MSLPIGKAEWIILDTNIVRGLIEGERSAINLEQLAALKRRHPISVADGAIAELVFWWEHAEEALLQRVKPALAQLTPILDPGWPIASGGKELLCFAGIIPYPDDKNRRDESELSKAVWRHVSGVESRQDLRRRLTYRNSTGRGIPLVASSPEPVLKGLQDTWITKPIAEIIRSMNETMDDATAGLLSDTIRDHTAESFGVPREHPAFARLEVHHRVLMHWVRIASQRGYVAKEMTSNVPIDMTLLYYLVVPAVVCTNDRKLVNVVRSTRLPDSKRVMDANELLNWLGTGELPA